MAVTPSFWHGKSVFLTGHTGFKGGWLALWLHALGARVHGYALPPPAAPHLFGEAGVASALAGSTLADVRDAAALRRALEASGAEVVLHLAAQPLVRHSYDQPVETYAVNVMGTVHLLDAVRACPTVRAVVIVTTDKCYENREWVWGYREDEALGGFDPYASSKACAELVTSAFRRSFLEPAGIGVASARAGNVIGGGDWAADRLVPDALRALDAGQALHLRSPQATRPWQHVLEPLSGYLLLAQRLCEQGPVCGGAWNFGPPEDGARPVQWIVERLASMREELRWSRDPTPQPHEAHYLALDSSKARRQLGWSPRWNLETALRHTLDWHGAWRAGQDMHAACLGQIDQYQHDKPTA